VVKMSEGAVAVGVGRLNPGENSSISAWDKIKTHRILTLSYFAHVDKFAGRVVS